MLRYLTACLWLLFIQPAHAASEDINKTERDLRLECSGIGSEVDMANCLQQKASASEDRLKQAEKNLQQTLSQWDESEKYIRLAKTRFTESEKSFIQYRKEQCMFASSLNGGAVGGAPDVRQLA